MNTNKKTKPITPNEVAGKKAQLLPNEVIESFNELIALNFEDGSSVFKQDEVVKLIRNKMSVDIDKIFENCWLDVKPIYEEAGWTVEYNKPGPGLSYDKPGFNESYPATFTFTKKSNRS